MVMGTTERREKFQRMQDHLRTFLDSQTSSEDSEISSLTPSVTTRTTSQGSEASTSRGKSQSGASGGE
jgi:hypothetical protein